MFARRNDVIILISLVAVCAFLGAIYLFTFNPSSTSTGTAYTEKTEKKTEDCDADVGIKMWSHNVDLECPLSPMEIKEHTNKIKVRQYKPSIAGVPDVFCQEALPYKDYDKAHGVTGLHILLLHGQKFSSQTWVDNPMQTLQSMSLLGHHAVACDLPGFGKTAKPVGEVDKIKFIDELILKFKLEKPFLVSPSMSGSYALPYLTSKPENLKGYIPVAPVMASQFKDVYSSIQTPTLIIYGDLDTTGLGAQSYEHLKLLPNHKLVIFDNARHAAYLDQPVRFNNVVNNFMNIIKKHDESKEKKPQ